MAQIRWFAYLGPGLEEHTTEGALGQRAPAVLPRQSLIFGAGQEGRADVSFCQRAERLLPLGV